MNRRPCPDPSCPGEVEDYIVQYVGHPFHTATRHVNDEYVTLPVADVKALLRGYSHASVGLNTNDDIDAADEASDRIQECLPK